MNTSEQIAYAQAVHDANTLREERYLTTLALVNCLRTFEAMQSGRLTAVETAREVGARVSEIAFALAWEAA